MSSVTGDLQKPTLLAPTEEAWKAFEEALELAKGVIFRTVATSEQPYHGLGPEALAAKIGHMMDIPSSSAMLTDVLAEVEEHVVKHSVMVHHPHCAAHLHCPPFIPAIAAELLIAVLNQSLDSWDQSPAATILEQELIRWLLKTIGYDAEGDGIFTGGGTQSNYMGLLLAREQFCKSRFGVRPFRFGLPPEARKMKVLCQEHAHFTVARSAAQLGLGSDAVVLVKADDRRQMDLDDLQRQLATLKQRGQLPFALVATAGTTDFGSIDPLPELAALARQHRLWLHADASYGGALLLSKSERSRLEGLEKCDSCAIDFHKWFYQPISCAAFLVRDRSSFNLMKHHADYLNPKDDENEGIPHLVAKSTQTTRRFDALKLFITLKTLGTQRMAEIVESTMAIAKRAAEQIENDGEFELLCPPQLGTVVFRYVPGEAEDQDQVHRLIARNLFAAGKAVIARTKVDGRICLKMTILNPSTREQEVTAILQEIKRMGTQLAKGVNADV